VSSPSKISLNKISHQRRKILQSCGMNSEEQNAALHHRASALNRKLPEILVKRKRYAIPLQRDPE